MRQILRNIAILFLISAVMISTSGAVITKHYCPSSGRTDISLVTQKSCCGSQSEEKTSDCCTIEVKVLKEDFETTKLNLSFGTLFNFQVDQPVLFTIIFQKENTIPFNSYSYYSPPHGSDQSIPVLFHQFLI